MKQSPAEFHNLQMKNIQPVEKTKFVTSKKTPNCTHPSPPLLPSPQTTPPAKRGLEAGLKMKLSLASRVGREGKV